MVVQPDVRRRPGLAPELRPWLAFVALQLLRVLAALLVAAGLAVAAAEAAHRTTTADFLDDLAAGRVTEVVFGSADRYPPGVGTWGTGSDPTVRWKTGTWPWSSAPLDPMLLDPDGNGSIGSGAAGDAAEVPTVPGVRAELERRARAAGVPVASADQRIATTLASWSRLVAILLVVLLVIGEQPRRATKWAWFWLMVTTGGLAHLAWLAVESPWSRRALLTPEPAAHRGQPADRRLTGGRALLAGLAFALLSGVAAAEIVRAFAA